MQYLFVIADTLSKIDIDSELTAFLCSAIAFILLMAMRKRPVKMEKMPKRIIACEEQVPVQRSVAASQDETKRQYVQLDKEMQSAFEEEDYWQVMECWNKLKHFQQSSIHLSMIIRAMRSCNKGGYFIVAEIRNFFKAHPKVKSIAIINELLEPLSRSQDDAQLVDLLVKMIPSIHLAKDSRTCEILLTMHAANRSFDKAQDIMAEMRAKDIVFTPRATVAVMTMGLQTANVDIALKALAKLRDAWDVRSTWAVSMFTLERHKSHILIQIVTLACEKRRICELASALDGMVLPEEVLDALQAKIRFFKDVDLATTIAFLEKSGRNLKTDAIYNTLSTCFSLRSNTRSVPGRDRADSSASTSEGSRSDDETEPNLGSSLRPPPGLVH